MDSVLSILIQFGKSSIQCASQFHQPWYVNCRYKLLLNPSRKELDVLFSIFDSMRKYLYPLLFLFALPALGQHEELSQKIEAFVAEHSDNYEKRHLNIDNPPIGDIDETNYTFAERFMLRGKEEVMTNLDREMREKIYVNVYGYYDESERDYAMKYWLENFIEGESIRPGRDKRNYDYAHPTIIVINEDNIAVLHFDCPFQTREYFQDWRDKMLSYFGDANSVIMELECNGPLTWTKNAPEPRDRTWR